MKNSKLLLNQIALREKWRRLLTFLVDYEFLNNNESGLDLILELDLKEHSILVASRYEDAKIQVRCEANNMRLNPKPLSGFVLIEMQN